MKPRYLIFFSLLFSFQGFAQEKPDTIFFNKKWEVVSKNKSLYYRTLTKKSDTCMVHDYYSKSHLIQMSGMLVLIHPMNDKTDSTDKYSREGLFKYYDTKGRLEKEINFEGDKLNGYYKEYFSNGNTKFSGFYLNDSLNGEWKGYNYRGIPQVEGFFIKNEKNGEWKWYYPNGTLQAKETYSNGKLHGKSLRYNERGHRTDSLNYINDERIVPPFYERHEMTSALLLRGKLVGGFLFEDWWMLNLTVGLEYRFAKNHSIGLDYIYFRHRYEQEQYLSNNTDDYIEKSQYNPRHALLVDYRFYMPFSFSKKRPIIPYLNIYGKYGTARIYHQSGYEFDSAGIFKQWERFYDVGTTIGIHWGFDPDGKGGFDFCVGVVNRFKTEDIEYYSPTGVNWFVYGQQSSKLGMACRFNLYRYLWKKKKPTVARD